MARNRFTTFGLALALLGWIVLVADAALSPFLAAPGNMAAVASLRSDIFSVAETTIVSGFALAIIGTLRAGFGALHRFFEAVLARADAPRPAPPVAPHAPHGPVGAHAPHGPAYPDAPPVTLEPQALEPVIEGTTAARPPSTKGRNYTILANGAVEVETLLGTKVFASLDEARDFIR